MQQLCWLLFPDVISLFAQVCAYCFRSSGLVPAASVKAWGSWYLFMITVHRESRQRTEWAKYACGIGTAATIEVHRDIYKQHWGVNAIKVWWTTKTPSGLITSTLVNASNGWCNWSLSYSSILYDSITVEETCINLTWWYFSCRPWLCCVSFLP